MDLVELIPNFIKNVSESDQGPRWAINQRAYDCCCPLNEVRQQGSVIVLKLSVVVLDVPI